RVGAARGQGQVHRRRQGRRHRRARRGRGGCPRRGRRQGRQGRGQGRAARWRAGRGRRDALRDLGQQEERRALSRGVRRLHEVARLRGMRTMGVSSTVASSTVRVVVALLLVVAFLPGCRSMTGRSAGRYIDDKTISAEVKAKLVRDKTTNLTRVGVTTVNGIVHLDGAVDSVNDKTRAEEITRTVNGVTNVVNNLQVTSSSASPR